MYNTLHFENTKKKGNQEMLKKQTKNAKMQEYARLPDIAFPNYRPNNATTFTLLFAWFLTNPVVIPSTGTPVSPWHSLGSN